MSARMLPALLLLMLLGPPGHAALAQEACEQDLIDFRRISEAVIVSDEVEREAEVLWHAAKQHCDDGKVTEARARLNEAFSMVAGDSDLMVPTVGALATASCGEAAGLIEQEMGASDAGAFARETADALVADAKTLCEDGEKLKAQDKFSMAWSMIKQQ